MSEESRRGREALEVGFALKQLGTSGVRVFAEYLLTNIGTAWVEASLAQRQQIQRAMFPDGLPFNGQNFGTRSQLRCVQLLTGN